MKKILFIDRDGTIIIEPKEDQQVDSLEKLEFLPGAISSLRKIAEQLDYRLVMVTNQDGLGTISFPEETFWPAQYKIIDRLKGIDNLNPLLFEHLYIGTGLNCRPARTIYVKDLLLVGVHAKQVITKADRGAVI